MKKNLGWQFTDQKGTFNLENPQHTSYLYFPLVNEIGMMSSISPTLNGDIKTSQNSFLTLPVSVEDLHNTKTNRNFWLNIEDYGPWSAVGVSAKQIAANEAEKDHISIEAGFLWHKLTVKNEQIGIKAETINFTPMNDDKVELMQIKLTNIANKDISFSPVTATMIYGRSADNIRDHRHVTSLLNRMFCNQFGIINKPTLTFDERGHQSNQISYAVLAVDGVGNSPIGYTPTVEDFIGEGGSLDWPCSILKNTSPLMKKGESIDGYEAMGAIHFEKQILRSGQSISYIVMYAIWEGDDRTEELIKKYGTAEKLNLALKENKNKWEKKLSTFEINTGNNTFDQWTKWISIQPTLRRLYGNSFLPYHDYGRGGRGWRDLWQDILALLLVEDQDLGESLYQNFAGIRMDGSNATIIGNELGEFKADRNNIPRVWMDHGAWPLLTTDLYINQTGDINFLLKEQTYFKDHLIFRSQKFDQQWHFDQGVFQKTDRDKIYTGTIIEHLIIQHLVQFFNVGEHNIIRTEGADWNDGMDLAPDRGESVAFTALYASNLNRLSEILKILFSNGIKELELPSELVILLDTLNNSINYDVVEEKTQLLTEYFELIKHTVKQEKTRIKIRKIAEDLKYKADWSYKHLSKNEWIQDDLRSGWFNGYYDNDGNKVEKSAGNQTLMTLTGQVFTMLGSIANQEQAQQIINAADKYLWEEKIGGYRLNTNFNELRMNLGRAFGFAYGHKENGAMFSHMSVMFSYALYKRGFIKEGYRTLNQIFEQSCDFEKSRMYPGIPEYFNQCGRGMYTYLTGSASWYILTLVTEMFGISGNLGNLQLSPKITKDQFINDEIKIITLFAGKKIHLVYKNIDKKEYDEYLISSISLNDELFETDINKKTFTIPRDKIQKNDIEEIKITINLK